MLKTDLEHLNELNIRLNNLYAKLDTLLFISKKINNIISKNCPEKILEDNSVLFSVDVFKKLFNTNPELFSELRNFETGDPELIYKNNHKSLEFKKILYKNKYN